MRELLLLRHAKSDWPAQPVNDASRPLNARGREAAPLMGALIAARRLAPDLALCSTAVRTRQTLALLWPHVAVDTPTQHLDALYLASPETMAAVLAREAGDARCVLIVAHNPGLEELARRLADPARSNAEALSALMRKYPTGGLAHFAFDAPDWTALAAPTALDQSAAALTFFATPADA